MSKNIEEKAEKVEEFFKMYFESISFSDQGDKVVEVQQLLNKFGYSLEEDGLFGEEMREVVLDFQAQVGMEVTGTVNEEMYERLLTMEATNLALDYLLEKGIFIAVPTVMQTPELPNGCEITSLTCVLNYHGYDVSKTVMSDQYLPKMPFAVENGVRYGPDPNDFYVGEPRSQHGGWYSFAPPVVAAGNQYLEEIGSDLRVHDLTGSSMEDILQYIVEGTPVVVWVTLDLSPPRYISYWQLEKCDEFYEAYRNLHVVVLNGVEGDYVHALNPLFGQVRYQADAFFRSYYELGRHAVVVN